MLNTETILGIVFTVIIVSYLIFRSVKRKANDRTPNNADELNTMPNYNDKFIENAEGKKSIRLVKTYNPRDVMLICSLLDSEGIFSFTEFENLNSLYPGIAVDTYSDTMISVFVDDLDDARTIISDYIEKLRKIEPVSIKKENKECS